MNEAFFSSSLSVLQSSFLTRECREATSRPGTVELLDDVDERERERSIRCMYTGGSVHTQEISAGLSIG